MNRYKNPLILWSGYALAGVLLLFVINLRSRLQELEQIATPTKIKPRVNAEKGTGGNGGTVAGPAKFQDGRTQQLFSELEEIAAGSKPGELNPRFQAKAWDVLMDSDFERRSRNFGTLLDILRPEDAAALHVAFNKMHQEGRDFGDEYARFATRWGQIDGTGALSYLFQENERVPSWDVHNLLKGWSQVNPQEALAWTLSNRERVMQHSKGPQQDPLAGVLRGWARQDPEAATKAMLEQMPDPGSRMEATRLIFVESLFGRGMDATVDWLKQLPGSQEASNPAGEMVVGDLFRRLHEANTAPELAAQQFLKIADQPWVGLGMLENTNRMFSTGNDSLADNLAKPAARPVMQQKFTDWAKQNPDMVGQWLNQNRSSALYDVGAAELARSLTVSDPEAAATWAKTIKDPALQARAIK